MLKGIQNKRKFSKIILTQRTMGPDPFQQMLGEFRKCMEEILQWQAFLGFFRNFRHGNPINIVSYGISNCSSYLRKILPETYFWIRPCAIVTLQITIFITLQTATKTQTTNVKKKICQIFTMVASLSTSFTYYKTESTTTRRWFSDFSLKKGSWKSMGTKEENKKMKKKWHKSYVVGLLKVIWKRPSFTLKNCNQLSRKHLGYTQVNELRIK